MYFLSPLTKRHAMLFPKLYNGCIHQKNQRPVREFSFLCGPWVHVVTQNATVYIPEYFYIDSRREIWGWRQWGWYHLEGAGHYSWDPATSLIFALLFPPWYLISCPSLSPSLSIAFLCQPLKWDLFMTLTMWYRTWGHSPDKVGIP